MNTRSFAVFAVIAAVLIGATAIATEDASATKRENNQATSQTNACGNGEMPINVFCSNTGSQVQGDENAVAQSPTQSSN